MSAADKAPPKGAHEVCCLPFMTLEGRKLVCDIAAGHLGPCVCAGEPAPRATVYNKDVPRGALEEAVSLYDECRTILNVHLTAAQKASAEIVDFDRRRAALEPRLAKRRENQAKIRCEECVGSGVGLRDETCSRCKGAGRIAPPCENQAKPRGDKST